MIKIIINIIKKITTLTLIGVLLINPVSSAVPWTAGDTFDFTVDNENITEFETTDGVKAKDEIKISASIQVIVDEVDTDNEEITYILGSDTNTESYAIDTIFLFFDYNIVEDNGKKYITDFDIEFSSQIFVDPDFNDINSILQESYDTQMENQELQDVIDSGTFNFMGEDSSLTAVTFDTQQKWEFEIDLSNEVYQSEFVDGELVFTPFSNYMKSLTVEYDDDGVLKSSVEKFESEIDTDDGIMTETETLLIVQGGAIAAFFAPGFSFYLISLLIIPVVIRKRLEVMK